MRRSLMLLILMLVLMAPAYAQESKYRNVEALGLQVGDAAPAFSLQGSDGKTHSLAELAGKTVVIAWFPKAFTGG